MTVTAQNSIWNIDPAHSVAEFKVKHMMIANVKGYFSKITGVLTRDESNVANSSVEVSIEADIFVTSLELASRAETAARGRLEQLLHPLRGGADGRGWEFGRSIGKSDVFAALEKIDEIDRVENLRFRFRGQSDPDRVVIGPNELLASGEHRLAVKKA